MIPEPTRSAGLALVGYRGTGKTTVGRILADRLGWAFRDADEEVEARAGRPIPALFRDLGEPAFRDLEEQVLRDLTGRRGLVLATGGGAVLREANRKVLRGFGFVAWLTADPLILADRLARDPAGRPALTPAGLLIEIAGVLEARTPLYRESADVAIATDRLGPADVADSVLRAWSRSRGGPP